MRIEITGDYLSSRDACYGDYGNRDYRKIILEVDTENNDPFRKKRLCVGISKDGKVFVSYGAGINAKGGLIKRYFGDTIPASALYGSYSVFKEWLFGKVAEWCFSGGL